MNFFIICSPQETLEVGRVVHVFQDFAVNLYWQRGQLLVDPGLVDVECKTHPFLFSVRVDNDLVFDCQAYTNTNAKYKCL